MSSLRSTPHLLCASALIVTFAGCPAEDEPADDTADAGPVDNEGGRPPFEVVDGGPDPDGGPDDTACVDDALEDNDTVATAAPLVVGTPIDAHACGGDDDWYAFDVAEGCVVAANLELTAPEGGTVDALSNLDLVLVDAASVVIGTGGALGPRESLIVTAPAAGRYAIRVDGGANDDVDYRLVVSTFCDGAELCPADDAAEDNDTVDTATPLDRGVDAAGVVCGGDVDFWALPPVSAGCMADVSVTFEHARGDLDLELFSTTSSAALGASAGTGDTERVLRVVDPATTVAKVFLFNGTDANVGNAYRIAVGELCESSIGCPGDDPFENNDARPTATKLEASSEIVGAVCGVDEDFYRYALTTGCTTTFTAAFDHAAGDIDLKLQNGAGNELGSSVGTTDVETIAHTPTANGDVFVRVFGGVSGAQNSYRLTAATTCP
ncbi:MAG TPA: PPC domain-containing protein [Myxococcota bacterium]